jgi:hypothetical protein
MTYLLIFYGNCIVDQILIFRMKSLEADAMKAEAVIARAQEFKKNTAVELALAGNT